jgi:outer membrane protein OmpA-like peptidoglycan-associated protein
MMHPGTNTGMSNSFTDLMTSLAVIFILLLCASLNNAQQEGQTTRNSVLAEVQRELKEFVSGGIEVKSDPKDPLGLLILVPEDLLAFPLDRADISPNGELFLRSFIPKLSKIVCSQKFAKDINSIVVEGHTDSSGTAQHNWDLSQKRSMSVVRTSLGVLNMDDTEEEKMSFLRLLSASGRGSAELVTSAAGEENAALSRRVVFKIRVRSFEQKPLLEALKSKGA